MLVYYHSYSNNLISISNDNDIVHRNRKHHMLFYYLPYPNNNDMVHYGIAKYNRSFYHDSLPDDSLPDDQLPDDQPPDDRIADDRIADDKHPDTTKLVHLRIYQRDSHNDHQVSAIYHKA